MDNDFLNKAALAFFTQQGREREQNQSIVEQLSKLAAQTRPTTTQRQPIRGEPFGDAQVPSISGFENRETSNPVFEQLVTAIEQANRGGGLIGDLQDTEGGGTLGNVGRGVLGLLSPTLGGGADSPINREFLTAIANATQEGRKQERGDKIEDLESRYALQRKYGIGVSGPEISPSERARQGVSGQLQGLKEAGFSEEDIRRKLTGEPRQERRPPNFDERLSTSLAQRGFVVMKGPTGTDILTDVKTNTPVGRNMDPSRLRDYQDAVLEASGGQPSPQAPSPLAGGGSAAGDLSMLLGNLSGSGQGGAPAASQPTQSTAPDVGGQMRDDASRNLKQKLAERIGQTEQSLGRRLTPDEEDRILEEMIGGR